ncbi:MAG: hypothetical protein K2Y23_21840 [Cyanobacteria bacterium]|nr:hypothetical protein [Cyanobacteriota bacterium]
MARHATPVVIEGAKTPELIPEWYRWERVLTRTAEAVQIPDSDSAQHLSHTLVLSEADLTVLRKEAEVQTLRHGLHKRRVNAALESFDRTGIKPEDLMEKIYNHLFALELEYRREILVSRARVLEGLSTEGQLALATWIHDVLVKNTKVILSPLDVNRFAQPQ